MNFFKRALLSIQRRKGKSLILFLVIFILGNLMAGAIAIQQATKGVEQNIKTQLGATATVGYNEEKMQELQNETKIKEPTVEVYKELGELKQVKTYDYSVTDFLTSTKIKNVVPEDGSFQMGSEGTYFFTIKGTNSSELMDEQTKKISLDKGRNFSEEELKKGAAVTILSDKVAKENNINVGDKIVLDRTIEKMQQQSSDSSEVERKSKDYSVEVVGIFKVNEVKAKDSSGTSQKDAELKDMQKFDLYDKLNVMYCPNDYVQKTQKEMLEFEYDTFPDNFADQDGKVQSKETVMKDYSSSIQATFVLNKPEDVEDFKVLGDQILKDNKMDYFKIQASSDQFDSIAGPIKGMAKISKIVLIVSVIASVFIITLVTILFLRDRKHELGIYLSLGEKRKNVVAQIVIEVVVVAILSMTLSVFSGNFLAKTFSQSLIATQQTSDIDQSGYMMGSSVMDYSVTEADVVNSYEIKLTPSYIALFYLIGLIVVLLSTIVPLIYIMRLNPKKIMM